METWLTYLAALLMAGATAFTFSSSSSLFGMMSTITSYLTGVASFLFLVPYPATSVQPFSPPQFFTSKRKRPYLH